MKISVRNRIGDRRLATVKVDIGGGGIVTSSIIEDATGDLGLAPGDRVTVIVRASDVLIGK